MNKITRIDESVAGRPIFVSFQITGLVKQASTFSVVYPNPLTDEQVEKINEFVRQDEDIVGATRHASNPSTIMVSYINSSNTGGVLRWLQDTLHPTVPFTALVKVEVTGTGATGELIFMGHVPDETTLAEICKDLTENTEIAVASPGQRHDRLSIRFSGVPIDTPEARGQFFRRALGGQKHFGFSLIILTPPLQEEAGKS